MPEILSYVCPFCETEVRVGKPCSGCAKKARPKKKPWEQDPAADGLDLPSDDFDYNDFVAREFGKGPHRHSGLRWYWWALAVMVLLGMGYGVFRS
jgi:hypothetical protein